MLRALSFALAASHASAFLHPSTAASPISAPASVQWMDALALGVGGRAFDLSGSSTYARFPPAAAADLTRGEYSYGLDSAGMFVQFETDATALYCNYTLRTSFTDATPFANFSPIGASGVDLYAFDGARSTWRWVASSFAGLEAAMAHGSTTVLEAPLFANATGWPAPAAPASPTWPGSTRFRLHFPQYNGVLSLSVGVPAGASLAPDLSWNASAPALYLGTSITQGGVTERPGQAYVARLSAALPRPVQNYGLCGSCVLNPGLAKWVTAMPRVPAVLVVDCVANMDTAMVASDTGPFIRAVRAVWGPDLPIVLVEPIDNLPVWLVEDAYQRDSERRALRGVFDALVAAGDASLFYVNASALRVGADDAAEELTFEGVHPLDRGHALIAAAMERVLAPLLAAAPAERARAVAGAPPPPPTAAADTAADARWRAHADAAAMAAPLRALPFASPSPLADAAAPPLFWTDASALSMVGRAWPAAALPGPFARLPSAARGVVTDAVWSLSLNSAGVAVAFTANSSQVWVNFTLAAPVAPMVHFPASGVSGADLWAWDAGLARWRFVAAASLSLGQRAISQLLATVPSPQAHITYMLFLATYNEVLSLSIGAPLGSAVVPAPSPFAPGARPIIWYGTSILQGGVTIKVGNIETARVSMALNREVYNFGCVRPWRQQPAQ